MNKKVRDYTGIDSVKRNKVLDSRAYKEGKSNTGIGNTQLIEPIPEFNSAEDEKVISGDNNTYIVLGRDRPSDKLSGYGGRGDTQAGAIDIVVGRMGAEVREVNEEGERLYADPNFSYDSARVHIAQKTDVDENFNLAEGNVGNKKARSAIAVKADNVRVIGREAIKLITGGNRYNSQGGEIQSVSGIDLIAGNDDKDMQPIPKGKNLVEALEQIVEHNKILTGIIENFISAQLDFNGSIITHTHVTSPSGQTTPSPSLIASGLTSNLKQFKSFSSLPMHRTNVESFKFKYLKPVGKKYINSRFNSTN